MSIFAKRHYEWLANELRRERKLVVESGIFLSHLDDQIYYLSNRLEVENPAFNKERFLKAIFKPEQKL